MDETSILEALDSSWIRDAVLDVFPVEPLPASSPLWSHQHVHITPHVSAATDPEDLSRLFIENLKRWCISPSESGGEEGGGEGAGVKKEEDECGAETGASLLHEVRWEAGY